METLYSVSMLNYGVAMLRFILPHYKCKATSGAILCRNHSCNWSTNL